MKYTQKSFSVASPGTREYADNWERTFRSPSPELQAAAKAASERIVHLRTPEEIEAWAKQLASSPIDSEKQP